MVGVTRFGWRAVPAATVVAATLGLFGGACGSPTPMDQNLGTNLGADFVAPVTDAGGDATIDVSTTGAGGGAAGAGGGSAGASGGSAGGGAAAADAGTAGAGGSAAAGAGGGAAGASGGSAGGGGGVAGGGAGAGA